MSILEVRDVSIRYITGDFKDIGLKEYVLRRLRHDYHVKEFWADRDISFTLEQGDMLGIIGTNGAGKSTLLKVISGIMEPTQGSVYRKGTIAALLELASEDAGDPGVRRDHHPGLPLHYPGTAAVQQDPVAAQGPADRVWGRCAADL